MASGALDGVGSINGILTRRPDDTFAVDVKAICMGEAEDCGTGTVHLLADATEGFYDGPSVIYTQHTYEIVPGGTLPVRGSFEALGAETIANDYSSSFDFTGELICDDAAD